MGARFAQPAAAAAHLAEQELVADECVEVGSSHDDTELVADQPETAPVAVVAAHDAMTLWSTPSGSAGRLLVSRGAIELWSWTLAPGDRRDSEPHRPGSVELIAVEAGTVALDVGQHRAEVPAGDSAWFDAALPHGYTNPDTTPAIFTLVVLEPA